VANKKISELTAATTPAETDVMPIVQAATTKKATVSAWVRAALLTGLSTATNAAITATDSVLVALGKAQAQITAILASLNGHIGNTTNAHGMTTPGAAVVQATSVADQRAALGLENHNLVRVDSAGNVGVGVIPMSTFGNYGFIEAGANGSSLFGGRNDCGLTANAIYSGSWKYAGNYHAARYSINAGHHIFDVASVGSPGGAITWTTAARITPECRCLFGNTPDDGTSALQVGGIGRFAGGVIVPDCANDAAAATAGVPVGGMYRTGTTPKVRAA